MEYIEGNSPKGPLPVGTVLDYARQMADALDAAHEKGITHRDLKPSNLKITPVPVVTHLTADGSDLRLLDFTAGLVAQLTTDPGFERDPV